ncbi:MAG: OB-fold domain-containing protein [Proteobacteria bacterium]|nr:OB-fold domain-containing protein [Pseudomonadota bacterium]MBU1742788.1 OB-fold domain-containing protein [Pseudomonadota bacterium]
MHSEMNQGLIVPGKISIPFSYAAGRTASRFLVELRDNQRIMGVRCPECERVQAPPQRVCLHCFVETEDWVEVGPGGRLVAHTVIYGQKPHHPAVSPLIHGLISLDGADSNFVHLIQADRPEQLFEGVRVEAVFAEDRQGHILDIEYFRPV